MAITEIKMPDPRNEARREVRRHWDQHLTHPVPEQRQVAGRRYEQAREAFVREWGACPDCESIDYTVRPTGTAAICEHCGGYFALRGELCPPQP